MENDNPQEVVQALPSEDFYFLVKKIGVDECLPLIILATSDQWQYLMDLEIWRKDRIHLQETSFWLERFQQADPGRLVKWLFGDGQWLTYYYFFKTVEVVVKEDISDSVDLPEDFFTFDGVFYIRVVDLENRDVIHATFKNMADENINRYHMLLDGLARVLPAEIEEEIYRLRNVRLAEHGLLPFERAISVYAPLEPDTLVRENPVELPGVLCEEWDRALIPILPLYQAGTQNLLTEAVLSFTDPLLADRIRLEFASLCNQLLSADGVTLHELDVLMNTCRKAAGYVNLCLERVCGGDVSLAGEVIKNNPLLPIFRVGFGLVLKLKWKAEDWLKGSWFRRQGLDRRFWGEQWGGTLKGLLAKRPKFYAGLAEDTEYREFERCSDLEECLKILRRLMVLDSLLGQLAERYPFDRSLRELTFHPLLFTLWARSILELEVSFSSISLDEARRFFCILRGSERPPYEMYGWEERFIADFMAHIPSVAPEAASIHKEALLMVWQEFREEYKWMALKELSSRCPFSFFQKPE